MTRPIQASLDLQALKQNLSIVRQAAPYARVWSVVKANAYGHGIERIWSALGATERAGPPMALHCLIWKRQ